jgi:hypothetical protein
VSDYIKKSGLAEEVIDAFCGDCTQCGGHCRHDDLVEIIEELPTISETEMIRKAFERVVERLDKQAGEFIDLSHRELSNNSITAKKYLNKGLGVAEAIEIVKEEGGIE